ncbi:MAG: hypothetical protein ABL958_08340, partial [Bdellovibrionia bacterium]
MNNRHISYTKLLFGLAFYLTFAAASNAAEPPAFRLHLGEEPWTLDPARIHGNEHSYFNSIVFRGLFTYDDEKGLVPAGAKKCYRPNKLKLVCELNPDSKWSDGSAVTANHYVQAY